MNTSISQYISECNDLYKAGNATEHSYRPALKILLEVLMPRHTATNEPKRIACGAPDYIITDRDFAVGYVEAKDIPVNLNDKTLKEQFDRYRNSLDNLIITNYLTFHWYAKGELVDEVAIGWENDDVRARLIAPLPENFHKFTELIRQFAVYHTEGIKTSAELSKQMAAKARLLAEIIENSLNKDIENKEDTELNNQYEGFKSILIDTISTKDFADLYAQTIAYGMFAARINYNETDSFTREKAAKSIPQTNPFLRKMFNFIAGVDLDSRISWVVDALADLFNYVDIEKIHKEIGRYADNDPIIHFYETFLTDYDKRLKKQRGVWYTPQPVVRFIVNAVNEILKTDFGIAKGLADNSKVTVGDSEYHKVQILDPATGTGTFLAEIVEQIYSNFPSKGVWNSYVNEHLIPRLNGFEILMASYAMAHLKLEMLLQETKAEITNNQRIRIYLTDSLDEENDKNKAIQKKTSILKWLTDEANEAANIKRKNPVMVILGNPPYSGESQNKGEWIMDLMEDYKKEPTGGRLQEKNSKWLNDDYAKFIRLGQHFVEKNGFGILAYINNHSFLDNPTFRGMRYNLLKTFDKIYIIDLHGNAKKKETAPDGSEDKNVFDIQQGVSINIFVKMPNNNTQPAQIYHYDLYGKRQEKYNYLLENNLQTMKWTELQPAAPNYFFVQKDFSLLSEYEKGFKITDLFILNSVGIVTANDSIFINTDKNLLISNIKNKFNIFPDNSFLQKIDYRPFDTQFVYYDSKKIERARENVMQHFLKGENVGLMICRQQKTGGFYHCLIHKNIVESSFVSNKTSEIGCSFPLCLYRTFTNSQKADDKKIIKTINLNKEIADKLTELTNLQFMQIDKDILDFDVYASEVYVPTENTIKIVDYIYAVLHSPSYREKYKEFLKIDFPRIPYPENAEEFEKMAGFGEKLRKLHLMENVEIDNFIANFPESGSHTIEKTSLTPSPSPKERGDSPPSEGLGEAFRVYINEKQYFDNVPKTAWNFYIGGYQPAQKWLKDRKGRTLNFDDIEHYRKMIWVLKETEEVMRGIDNLME